MRLLPADVLIFRALNWLNCRLEFINRRVLSLRVTLIETHNQRRQQQQRRLRELICSLTLFDSMIFEFGKSTAEKAPTKLQLLQQPSQTFNASFGLAAFVARRRQIGGRRTSKRALQLATVASNQTTKRKSKLDSISIVRFFALLARHFTFPFVFFAFDCGEERRLIATSFSSSSHSTFIVGSRD